MQTLSGKNKEEDVLYKTMPYKLERFEIEAVQVYKKNVLWTSLCITFRRALRQCVVNVIDWFMTESRVGEKVKY